MGSALSVSIVLAPLPAPMMRISASRSTPVALPTISACASVLALLAATALLMSLTVWPWPSSPTWTMSSPMISSSGRALEVRLGAAGHHRQRPALGFRRRAGHGRVDEADPALVQRGADAPRVRRRDRRHVDAQRPLRGAVRDAVVAEQHRLDLGAVDDHGDDDIAVRADLGRRLGERRAVLLGERLGPRARAVVDGQLAAGAGQVRRHARAHDPQPHEADPLHGATSYGSGHSGRLTTATAARIATARRR